MRSREAVIAEEYLWSHGRKALLAQEEGMASVLALCEKINDLPYELPGQKLIAAEELSAYSHALADDMEKRLIYGVETFLVNHRENPASGVTLVYLHGGGYVNQPYYEHLALISRLADETGCRAVFPLYPLAPKYTCQESYRAVTALYRSLLKTTDPGSILLMGDSAGGGMALGLAQQLRDQGLPQPAELILISPWLDVRCNNPEIGTLQLEEKDPMLTANFAMAGRAWAGGLPMDDPQVSPMFGSLRDLPPITLYTGTRELLWPDARRFAQMAREQGADLDYREWPEMNHCFPLYPIPEAVKAQDEMIEMIRRLDRGLRREA